MCGEVVKMIVVRLAVNRTSGGEWARATSTGRGTIDKGQGIH